MGENVSLRNKRKYEFFTIFHKLTIVYIQSTLYSIIIDRICFGNTDKLIGNTDKLIAESTDKG